MAITVKVVNAFGVAPAGRGCVCLEYQDRRIVGGRARLVKERKVKPWQNDGSAAFAAKPNRTYWVSIQSRRYIAEPRRQRVSGGETVEVFCLLKREQCPPEGMSFPAFGDLCRPLREMLEESRVLGEKLRHASTTASVQQASVAAAESLAVGVLDERRVLEAARLREGTIARDLDAAMLYCRLESIQRATLLNLFVKLYAVTISGRSIWRYVKEIDGIEADRLYAYVHPDLVDAVEGAAASSSCWNRVCGVLHPAPEGYKRDLSAKTKEPKGNLQVTLFSHCRPGWIATRVDADIDLEGRWLAHSGEAIRNHLTGAKTHPGIVYQILRRYQDIRPHWGFEISHRLRSRTTDGPWRTQLPMTGVCRGGKLEYGKATHVAQTG